MPAIIRACSYRAAPQKSSRAVAVCKDAAARLPEGFPFQAAYCRLDECLEQCFVTARRLDGAAERIPPRRADLGSLLLRLMGVGMTEDAGNLESSGTENQA